jgi:hypothetical protein
LGKNLKPSSPEYTELALLRQGFIAVFYADDMLGLACACKMAHLLH